MPHGHPDWGASAQLSTVYSLQDLAELAARLGSINTFDRRGNVVFLDDFEAGLSRWEVGTYGTGAAAVVSVYRSHSGAYAAKLTTGSDGAQAIEIRRQIPRPVAGKIGLEFSWAWDGPLWCVVVSLDLFNGATYDHYVVAFYRSTDLITLRDAAGVAQTIASGLLMQTDHLMFHTAKLVVDTESRKYVRLLFDRNSYDLSAYGCQAIADASTPRLVLLIGPWGNTANNIDTYVDDVIVTQNED